MLLEHLPLIYTGDATIDTQHRHLIDLLNLLIQGVDSLNHDCIQTALKGLTTYVVEHFTDEEALHLSSGAKRYEAHVKVHEKIILELDEMVVAYQQNPDSSLILMQLLSRIVRDFMDQVEHFDVPLAAQLKPHH